MYQSHKREYKKEQTFDFLWRRQLLCTGGKCSTFLFFFKFMVGGLRRQLLCEDFRFSDFYYITLFASGMWYDTDI